jgi:hypothetical protein
LGWAKYEGILDMATQKPDGYGRLIANDKYWF